MKHFLKIALLSVLVVIGFSAINHSAEAATMYKQTGDIFNSPTVTDNKVKITYKSGVTVKYVRHTKYLDKELENPAAYKQLKASTKFNAFAYSCPGYYVTRAYSDTAGSNLIGIAYTYVSTSDISNSKCEQLLTSGTQTPSQSINATHPVATVKETSKMITQNTPLPVTITNPTVIKDSDKYTVVQPTQEQITSYQAAQDSYQACMNMNSPTFEAAYVAANNGTNTHWTDFQCVDLKQCLYDYNHEFWFCTNTISWSTYVQNNDPLEPTTTENYIPDYYTYYEATCGEYETTDDCSVFESLGGIEPNGLRELDVDEPEEPVEQQTLQIRACKDEFEMYGILFDGDYQMPSGYSESDVKVVTQYSDNVDVTVDSLNKLFVVWKNNANFTLQVADSNVLTQDDFVNAQPCPTNQTDPDDEIITTVEDGLYIKACKVDETTNQYEISMMTMQFGEAAPIAITNSGNHWLQSPIDLSPSIPENIGFDVDNGNFYLTLDPAETYDFAFEATRMVSGQEYRSNVLTSAQILASSDCSTGGTITDPTTGNGEGENTLPSCYCPNIEAFGAGLGFICCVWDCPGLDDIINDFKGFLKNDLVGTATAPQVPEFEAPPMPNIFDVLNDVNKRNQPQAPTGQNAPGLDDASFTADELDDAAPDIEFREDNTGGFNIVDPLSTLPTDGSTAPRPKEETVQNPQLSNGGGNVNSNITPPTEYNGTATPPTSNSTATPPNYNDNVPYPTTN